MLDEASLLACAAYVDLNPIRAAIAETLEGSDHTSVQKRIEAQQQQTNPTSISDPEKFDGQAERPSPSLPDEFLAPLTIDEVSQFGRLFSTVAGCPSVVDARRSERTHRRFHLRRRVREIWPVSQ